MKSRALLSIVSLAAGSLLWLVGCNDRDTSESLERAWSSLVHAEAAPSALGPSMQSAAQLPPDVIAEPYEDAPNDYEAPAQTPEAAENPIARLVDGGGPPVHPLERFYTALSAIDAESSDARPLRVLQIGDSHTASDTFTGPLRTQMQNRFGDSGRGYLYAGTPWGSYRQADAAYSMSRGWSGGVGIRGGADQFSFGGARIVAQRSDEWVERAPCRRCTQGRISDKVVISFLEEPEGGEFRVRVNGEVVAQVSTASNGRGLNTWTAPLPRGENTVRIETTSPQRVTLFGISMTDSSPGITLDSVGINGAMARHFLAFNEAMSVREIAALEPDLLIFAFGANESVSSRYQVERPHEQALELLRKLEAYRGEVISLIARWRQGAPNAECLVLLPPDIRTRDSEPCVNYSFEDERLSGTRCVPQPPSNFAGLLNALRYAALSSGCAVWDQQRAMGGDGSIDIWRELRLASGDGVHLTSAGYEALAHAFWHDLMTNWSMWRSGLTEPLQTSVIHPSLATSARDAQ